MINYLNFAGNPVIDDFLKITMQEIGQKFYDNEKTKPKDLNGKQCTLLIRKLANKNTENSDAFVIFFVQLAQKFLTMKQSCFGNKKEISWAEDLAEFETHLKPKFETNQYPNSPILHTIMHIRSVLQNQNYGLGYLSTELSESAHYRLNLHYYAWSELGCSRSGTKT